MGKSQIKSRCRISNHSVNRFIFNHISNLSAVRRALPARMMAISRDLTIFQN